MLPPIIQKGGREYWKREKPAVRLIGFLWVVNTHAIKMESWLPVTNASLPILACSSSAREWSVVRQGECCLFCISSALGYATQVVRRRAQSLSEISAENLPVALPQHPHPGDTGVSYLRWNEAAMLLNASTFSFSSSGFENPCIR